MDPNLFHLTRFCASVGCVLQPGVAAKAPLEQPQIPATPSAVLQT